MANRKPAKINAFSTINKDGFEPIITEITMAENNFDVIMFTAEEMVQRSLLFHDIKNPSDMIQPLRDLVGDLKLIFAVIRRDIKSQYPSRDLGRGAIAHPTQQKAPIEEKIIRTHKTLCPLVLFFRIIAQGLSAYRVKVRENSWGPIRPLHDLLLSLQSRIAGQMPRGKSPWWPGLATCIMFHENDSIFTIASSSPRYNFLQGLDSLAKIVRRNHVRRLREQANRDVKERIDNMIVLCEAMGKDRTNNSFKEDPAKRAQVDGIGATFNPDGKYMPACFLDFWRFNMTRPIASRGAEALADPATRPSYGVGSCAEWELWMVKITKHNIMPGAVLRNHPLIDTRATFPRQDQNQSARPPNPPGYRKTSSPKVPEWKPPQKGKATGQAPPQIGKVTNQAPPPKGHTQKVKRKGSQDCLVM